MTETPLVSIVVPLFNRSAYTRVFLHAMRAVLPGEPGAELILVDNGSTDDTPAVLAELAAEHTVIRHERNLNFAGGCNAGLRRSRGRLVYFLNNDTVPLPGFLRELARALDENPDAAVAGSRLLFPDGTLQHAGMAFDRNRIPYHLYYLFPGDYPAAARPRDLQVVTGASLLVRRDDIESAGGFDEGFRNSYEDADLCLKLRRRGRRVLYWPASTLIHFESVSAGRYDHDEQNLRRFEALWHDFIEPDEERLYREDGFAAPPRITGVTAAALHHQLAEERAAARGLAAKVAALQAAAAATPQTAALGRFVVTDVPLRVEAGAPFDAAFVFFGFPDDVAFTVAFEAPGAGSPAATSVAHATSSAADGSRQAHVRITAPAAGQHTLLLRDTNGTTLLARAIQSYPRYDAHYEASAPREAVAGTLIRLPVTVENRGLLTWGATAVRAGYHWRTPALEIVDWQGWGVPLGQRLETGERATLIVPVAVPLARGPLVLEIDLAEEGNDWLSRLGVPPSRHTIEVLAVDTVPAGVEPSATAGAFDLPAPIQELRERLVWAERQHASVTAQLRARIDETATARDELRARAEAVERHRDEVAAALATETAARAALEERIAGLERLPERRIGRRLRGLFARLTGRDG